MKRIIIFSILSLLILIPISAHTASIKVITTTEDLAAIAKEIGGERVQVDFLARGVQDPHFLEPKPSYMLRLSQAQLFVQVGLELEVGWAPPLLIGARNSKIQSGGIGFVDASRGIEVLEVPTGPVDRSQGDVHPQGNPHYWLDPMNGKKIAYNIKEGLVRIDPDGKDVYEKNLTLFSKKLDAAILRWKEIVRPFEGEKVVTYHNSWTYFLRRFGIKAVGCLEPKPGISPSASHLQELIGIIRREKAKIIIMEPYFNGRDPRFVAEKSGAKLVILPPSVSVGTGVADYFQLFDYIVNTLENALR